MPDPIADTDWSRVLARGTTILHVTNIANNAILNAQMLNDAGYPSYVIQHDYYHFATCPEWVALDTDLYPSVNLGDDYFPNWWTLPAAARRRPRWYAQGPQHLAISYLTAAVSGQTGLADRSWEALEYQRLKAVTLRTTTPMDHAWTAGQLAEAMAGLALDPDERAAFERAQAGDAALARIWSAIRTAYPTLTFNPPPPFQPGYLDGFCTVDAELSDLLAAWRATGSTVAWGLEVPDGQEMRPVRAPANVRQEDADIYQVVIPWWRELFEQFDVLLAYGDGPIYTLLSGCKSYAAYEHGTIRTLPFADTAQGRLIRDGYLAADRVFITNGDYVSASPRLEFAPGQAIYAPHAFDDRAINQLAASHTRKPRERRGHAPVVRFFAPARQDWTRHDPISCKANHLIFEAMELLVTSGHTNFEVEFVEWGQDLPASREQIALKGLESYTRWCRPLAKKDLWRRYLDADGVLDQFLIASLSGVSFEALAAGARVITLAGPDMETFFGEGPPVLGAGSAQEIAAAMLQVIQDPDDQDGVGARARDWTDRFHSGHRMLELELTAFASMKGLNPGLPVRPARDLSVKTASMPKPFWQFARLKARHLMKRLTGQA